MAQVKKKGTYIKISSATKRQPWLSCKNLKNVDKVLPSISTVKAQVEYAIAHKKAITALQMKLEPSDWEVLISQVKSKSNYKGFVLALELMIGKHVVSIITRK